MDSALDNALDETGEGLRLFKASKCPVVAPYKKKDYPEILKRWVVVRFLQRCIPLNLDHFLDEYIDAAGIASYLFRPAAGKTGLLTDKPLYEQDAYRMIQRHAKTAFKSSPCCNQALRNLRRSQLQTKPLS